MLYLCKHSKRNLYSTHTVPIYVHTVKKSNLNYPCGSSKFDSGYKSARQSHFVRVQLIYYILIAWMVNDTSWRNYHMGAHLYSYDTLWKLWGPHIGWYSTALQGTVHVVRDREGRKFLLWRVKY